MQAKKGSVVIVILGLLGLVLTIAAAFLVYHRFLEKETPSTQTSRAIEPKTEYENPFDKKTQYVNPFAQYKNPFDNLK